jgi:hypothetical protein
MSSRDGTVASASRSDDLEAAFFLRVGLVLGGVEPGDPFGRVEGERELALRPSSSGWEAPPRMGIPTGDHYLQTGGRAASIARPTFSTSLDGRRGTHAPT